jgi:transposase InsO family protein
LFGSDKILAVLETKGFHTSKPLVRELMKEMGLRSFRSTAKRDHSLWNKLHPPKNHLQRNFNVEGPNQVWASDCTRISYKQQNYHICVIMDLYSRKIISYKISQRASTQLITSTFNEALIKRNFCTPMFHSDRGCQYTSFAFRKLLLKHDILQSFSQSGNPYDNGVVESFFSTFKQEEIYRTFYLSVKQLKQRIGEYIDFYNQNRPHRNNNYKTPNQKEEAYYNKINREV